MKTTRLIPILLLPLIPLPLPAPPTISPPDQEEQAAAADQDDSFTAAELREILINRASTLQMIAVQEADQQEAVAVQFSPDNTFSHSYGRGTWEIIETAEGLNLQMTTSDVDLSTYFLLSQEPRNNSLQFQLNAELFATSAANHGMAEEEVAMVIEMYQTHIHSLKIELTPE